MEEADHRQAAESRGVAGVWRPARVVGGSSAENLRLRAWRTPEGIDEALAAAGRDWRAFAGTGDCSNVNPGAFQPFLFYRSAAAGTFRSSAVCAYHFEDNSCSVPIGLGIGR